MNTILFKTWLIQHNHSPKTASDTVSRLKKLNHALIESPLSTSIDSEFDRDHCAQLVSSFSKNGKNETMETYQLTELPIGKKNIHTYKLALTKYLLFKDTFRY